MAGSAAYAGILQEIGAPEEWGQGAGAYGKRSPLLWAAPGPCCFCFWSGFDAAPGSSVFSIAQHGILAENG
jgi:hypothetical protein